MRVGKLPYIKRVVLKYFFFVACVLIVYSCANIVPPSGGPKDVIPPRVIKCVPENRSVRYDAKQIRIDFDEYIQLKNLNSELLVSPPMELMPDVSVRGKSLVIKIADTLKAHTTYNFYFGNSVVDITEGNSLSNFQYVFSTGDFVDSLSIKGFVNEAFDLKPAEGVFVMLYDSIADTVPYFQRPLYLTRTDKTGYFELNNLRDTLYKIFVLKDANSNLLFDLPYEKIAFADSAVEIDAKTDSTLKIFFEKVGPAKELSAKAKGILIFPDVIK